MTKPLRGVWVPAEIWADERLTPLDKMILVEIHTLDGGGSCYASNKYLAKFCCCSPRKVRQTVSKLVDLGLLDRTVTGDKHRYLQSKVAENAWYGGKIFLGGWQNLPHSLIEEFPIKEKENRKRKIMADAAGVLDGERVEPELRAALLAHVEYQLDNNVRMTTKMLKLVLKKTRRLEPTLAGQVAVVKQSTKYGWRSVWPLKEENQKVSASKQQKGGHGDAAKNVARTHAEATRRAEMPKVAELSVREKKDAPAPSGEAVGDRPYDFAEQKARFLERLENAKKRNEAERLQKFGPRIHYHDVLSA